MGYDTLCGHAVTEFDRQAGDSMTESAPKVAIIGAGLAGSEAALQLAEMGIPVRLYDMKPEQRSPAHHTPDLAEIVCSNSLGSQSETSASGLLKQEMTLLGCKLLDIARSVAVPAGQALAVDREAFSRRVTERIHQEPLITFVPEPLSDLPEDVDYTLVATGPMTTPELSETLCRLVNREQLYFFDAAAPIVAHDSIDLSIAFVQDRYAADRGTPSDEQSYINCPMDKSEYLAFIEFINQAERIELKSFEQTEANAKATYFESCLPVEVLAARGTDTLRFGPMKPVGLDDPRTGRWPYAAVQLRRDNAEGTLYNLVGFQTNLRWGDQKTMIQMIPGLAQAEVVRYGVMHRNTYLHSPEVLLPTLQLRAHPNVLIAGQLTGTEGYTESIASGCMAAHNLARLLRGETPQVPPRETMLGSLMAYITRPEACGKSFQPINSNWGIVPPLAERCRDKKLRNQQYRERALTAMRGFISASLTQPSMPPQPV